MYHPVQKYDGLQRLHTVLINTVFYSYTFPEYHNTRARPWPLKFTLYPQEIGFSAVAEVRLDPTLQKSAKSVEEIRKRRVKVQPQGFDARYDNWYDCVIHCRSFGEVIGPNIDSSTHLYAGRTQELSSRRKNNDGLPIIFVVVFESS